MSSLSRKLRIELRIYLDFSHLLGRRGGRKGNDDHRGKSERWCRTLFVRNVSVSQPSALRPLVNLQYNANMEKLRTSFLSFGEVKEFFDLVPKRGLIFITYVSLHPFCTHSSY